MLITSFDHSLSLAIWKQSLSSVSIKVVIVGPVEDVRCQSSFAADWWVILGKVQILTLSENMKIIWFKYEDNLIQILILLPMSLLHEIKSCTRASAKRQRHITNSEVIHGSLLGHPKLINLILIPFLLFNVIMNQSTSKSKAISTIKMSYLEYWKCLDN